MNSVVQAFVGLLKQSMRLGSVEVWLLAMLVGVGLLSWRRSRSWARSYFSVVLATLWLFSTPAVAEWLAGLTDGGYVPLRRAEDARGATTIVVLGGGSYTYHVGRFFLNETAGWTAFRVIEGARIFRLLTSPTSSPTLILMGGPTQRHDSAARPESDAMGGAALDLGLPLDALVFENRSKNTREQALEFKRMFAGHESEPFVLVTSPTHMARSMGAFRAVGLNPIASPSALTSDGDRQRWLPSDEALMISDSVIYDSAGRIYYRSRGWLAR
jgi:uncharacterized SAM-binding protein YcdF (DUF218 family)